MIYFIKEKLLILIRTIKFVKMKRHTTGRIYKLENNVNLVYIGQTTQTLNYMMGGHRTALKKGGRKTKLYEHMRLILIGLENFKPMILIETLTNCTKEEIQAREDFNIKQFDSVKSGLNGQYQDGGHCEHGRQNSLWWL